MGNGECGMRNAECGMRNLKARALISLIDE